MILSSGPYGKSVVIRDDQVRAIEAPMMATSIAFMCIVHFVDGHKLEVMCDAESLNKAINKVADTNQC